MLFEYFTFRPQKLVDYGDHQASAAHYLLTTRGHELSQERRQAAQDSLTQ